MTQSMQRWLLASVCCLAVTAQVGAAPAVPLTPLADAASLVTITLRPTANLAVMEVVVGDIATLEGGDAGMRERIADLDLAEFSALVPAVSISRDQVAYRLVLAGIPARHFRVQGADLVRAHLMNRVREALPLVTPPNAQPTAIEIGVVVVKSGGAVRLTAQVGPLRVETTGEALQDGRVGQLIRVRNADSHNVVNGRVVSQGVVEVQY
jgi:hypothetical protein